jgi:hypothetical protein
MPPLNPIGWITDAAGAVVGGVADAAFNVFVTKVEEALSWLFAQVAQQMVDLAEPRFGGPVFDQLNGAARYLTLAVFVATVIGSVGASVWRNSSGDTVDVAAEVPVTAVMIVSWYAGLGLWLEFTRALTKFLVGETMQQVAANGLGLDAGIAAFLRLVIGAMMIVFVVLFFIEMAFLGHALTIGGIIGQVTIALRPWHGTRNVVGKTVRNIVSMSLVAPLGAASMLIAVGNLRDAGPLGFGQAIAGLAGMAVSVLMPFLVAKFLPLDGDGDAGGRSALSTGAALAAGAVPRR